MLFMHWLLFALFGFGVVTAIRFREGLINSKFWAEANQIPGQFARWLIEKGNYSDLP